MHKIMRKRLFLALFLAICTSGLLSANPSFAYKVTTFQPLQPVTPYQDNSQYQNYQNQNYQNYQNPNYQNQQNALNYQNYGNNINNTNNNTNSGYENYPKISQVESMIFKKTYEGENIYNRLSRIEQKMFKQQYQSAPLANRVDNIISNIDVGAMAGISTRDLSELETRVFGQTYAKEDTDTRITRLEKEMMGAMQGGTIKQRYQGVRTAAKHYNSFPQQYASGSQYMPNNYYAKKPSLLGRVMDSLAGGMGMGTMTGYTPPIYDTYSQDMFSTGGYGQQNYYGGNRGGYYDNRNLGSGTGVRVFY